MNNKEIKRYNLKVRVYVVMSISILLLVLISYGYFYVTKNQEDRNELAGGCFNTSFTDGDSISVENAIPMTEEEGQQTSPYHFTLTNSCDERVKYYVILNVKDNSFNSKFINASIGGGYSQRLDTLPTNTMDGTIDTGYTSSYIIKTGLLNRTSVTENVRLWVNENVTTEDLTNESNSGFTAKIKVVSTATPEEILGTSEIMNLVQGEPTNTTNVITKTAPQGSSCTNTFAYDRTTDNNLRYVGANPCNYVTFDGKIGDWRIVGIMNNIDDGTGKLETRIKLVRTAGLGGYSWDTSASTINSGKGINDWTQADLMQELNGDYLDTSLTENTLWYYGQNNEQTKAYDHTKSLSDVAQSLIGNAKWNLGGYNTYNAPASTFYTAERGTTVYSGRPTQWTGKVALIYPSDFGYAVGGDVRSTCLTKNLYNYDSDNCAKNNWLITYDQWFWLLSPNSNYNCDVFYFQSLGRLGNNYTYIGRNVRPTVYLNSSASIIGGNGSQENPYVFQ